MGRVCSTYPWAVLRLPACSRPASARCWGPCWGKPKSGGGPKGPNLKSERKPKGKNIEQKCLGRCDFFGNSALGSVRDSVAKEDLPQFRGDWVLLGITALPGRAFPSSGMNWVLLGITALPKRAFPSLGVTGYCWASQRCRVPDAPRRQNKSSAEELTGSGLRKSSAHGNSASTVKEFSAKAQQKS